MAVFEGLRHHEEALVAPAIGAITEDEDAPTAEAGSALPDVTAFAQLDVESIGDDCPPGWEPECGTPVHSKAHVH